MGFKFRVLINLARIYFRGSLISHFFFNREKRQIMYTNKKYNKADLCFCLSMPSTHIPREIRILTKLFQCHSKGPLLHSERKKSVVSSETQNDYIFKQQILGQFGEIGFKKIKQTKNTLRGLYFELLNKETKQIIENEVTDRASVQIIFCSQFSFSCSSCSLPAPLSSFL